jgi:hypothetical protein
MSGTGDWFTVQVKNRTFLALLLVFSLASGIPLWAQDHASGESEFHSDLLADLPVITHSAAAPPAVIEPPPQLAAPHRFWDRENRLLFSGVGLFRALDYSSTRNMQARGREEILLSDEVVNNSAGFASLEAAGTAASVALSYWMHRTSHHRVERWISVVHIGVTGFGAARNYALKSRHPASPAIR